MQVTYFKSAVHIGALYYVIKVSIDGAGEMEQQLVVLAAYTQVQEFRSQYPHDKPGSHMDLWLGL